MTGLIGCLSVLLAQPVSAQMVPVKDENLSNRVGTVIAPLLNFTTDRGFGYGAYGAFFFGNEDVPEDAPYWFQVGAQFYQTTGGYQDHKLTVDVPSLAGGRLRADMHVGWERWDQAYYFGQGNNLPRLRPKATPEHRYAFGLNSVRAVAKMRYQLVDDWHVFGGLLYRSAAIDVYPNSRLADDDPVGSEGGLLGQMFAGLMLDSRDHEFAPTSGWWSEISARTAHPVLGSTWAMWGLNLTNRNFWSLGSRRLVLATRNAVDVQKGETPFFHQIVMGGSQWVDIGGPLAMRGLPIGRYRGDLTLYGDAELRWEVADFSIGRAGMRFFTVPFLSGARIVQPGENDARLHPHGGAGVGLRLLYKEVFQARLDTAVGREEYLGERGQVERGWIPAFYLAFNSPF